MNYQSRSLSDVINDIKTKTKVPVVLDNMVFQLGLDPTQPVVTVNLKQVKLRDGLKSALAPYNLKFGLTADGVFISTEDGVITRQLRQRVSVDCDGTAFAAVARQLALDTGANIVVDPRLGEKGKKAVTLKLDDVPLETAVRLLAEVADLRGAFQQRPLRYQHRQGQGARVDRRWTDAAESRKPVLPDGRGRLRPARCHRPWRRGRAAPRRTSPPTRRPRELAPFLRPWTRGHDAEPGVNRAAQGRSCSGRFLKLGSLAQLEGGSSIGMPPSNVWRTRF